jgi:vacuolar-type H+-ATPase subunit E/Vma4
MAEEIKDLIEKIQQEGILAAEEKARGIEEGARRQAQAVVAEANKEANKIISDAREKASRAEEGARLSLEQAGRDLMLALRRQINDTLQRVISAHIQKALSPEELARIITAIIKESGLKDSKEIVVSLNKGDLEKIEKGFLGSLKDELKQGLVLRADSQISGGFIISYDGSKSHFDFTDKALAQYLITYLKPSLAAILGAPNT